MSEPTDKIPLKEKLIYGAAGITDMWSAFTMVRLQVPIFTVLLGLSPTLVGIQQASSIVHGMLWFFITLPIFAKASGELDTMYGMRLILALAPAIIMFPALFILARYPLGSTRVGEIRHELERRRGTL